MEKIKTLKEKKVKSFLGGFASAIVISILAGTDTGKSIVRKLRERYDLTMPYIKGAVKVFWVAELIAVLLFIAVLSAENYEAAVWFLSVIGFPFLALMFFIKALFPVTKRVIRSFAIPLLMLSDILIIGVLIFVPIIWTGSTYVLFYLSFIRLFADLGMITGKDTNRPYKMVVAGIIIVAMLQGSLNLTGYGVLFEKWHWEMHHSNLKKGMKLRVVMEKIIPYKLFDDELEKIKNNKGAFIDRPIDYSITGVVIDSGTTVMVCDQVKVLHSFSGAPNIVIALLGPRGDYNPGPDSLKNQFFIIPLEKTKSKSEYDEMLARRAAALLEKARADSVAKYKQEYKTNIELGADIKPNDTFTIHNPNGKNFKVIRVVDSYPFDVKGSDDPAIIYTGIKIKKLIFAGNNNRLKVKKIDRLTYRVL